ncbi:MAG: hypothetical protein MN733_38720 [Nitrososphaera sp.]|nr:hypothetical protein [Nitrososphaera sp.]
MKFPPLEIIINTAFDGFSLNTEMALWLMENCGWPVDPNEYPVKMLFSYGSGDNFFHPRADSIEFRSHKDLVDCVRAIKEIHKNDAYPEKYYGHIHGLAVVTVKVNLSVENYHDGKEKINIVAGRSGDSFCIVDGFGSIFGFLDCEKIKNIHDDSIYLDDAAGDTVPIGFLPVGKETEAGFEPSDNLLMVIYGCGAPAP